MGWTIPYDMPRRANLIRERTETRTWEKDGSLTQHTALKHCYRGGMRSGVLYIVWETAVRRGDAEPVMSRFIEIDLLKYYRGPEFSGGGSWGYKDMDCCCGPVAVSCPESYLDLCPPHPHVPDRDWCANWHAKVRNQHAMKRAMRLARRAA